MVVCVFLLGWVCLLKGKVCKLKVLVVVGMSWKRLWVLVGLWVEGLSEDFILVS